ESTDPAEAGDLRRVDDQELPPCEELVQDIDGAGPGRNRGLVHAGSALGRDEPLFLRGLDLLEEAERSPPVRRECRTHIVGAAPQVDEEEVPEIVEGEARVATRVAEAISVRDHLPGPRGSTVEGVRLEHPRPL